MPSSLVARSYLRTGKLSRISSEGDGKIALREALEIDLAA